MKIIDVSINLSPNTPVWPDVPKFEFDQNKTQIGFKEQKTDSRFSMIPHCGTHVDAPLHFDSTGLPVNKIDLEIINGRCTVLEYKGESHITKSDLDKWGFWAAKRLLIKTRNSRRLSRGELGSDYISLKPDALDYIIQSGIKVLGLDGFSIGPYGSLSDQNHLTFCRTGGIIIEMLDLSRVEPGIYSLLAFPLKIENCEAAPARVALVRPDDLRILTE